VDRIMVAAAIGMALVFAAGVILGFLVTISMASNRDGLTNLLGGTRGGD
jgi:hypothetical protein